MKAQCTSQLLEGIYNCIQEEAEAILLMIDECSDTIKRNDNQC